MARRDRHLLLLALASHNILRNPRRHKMRPQLRQLLYLLHQMLKLVKPAPVSCRKIMKSRPIRPRTDIADFQAPFTRLLFARPSIPPRAAKLRQLLSRACAIYKSAQLADRLAPKTPQTPVRNQRKTVLQPKMHLHSHYHLGPRSLPRLTKLALVQNLLQNRPVLSVGRALVIRFVTHTYHLSLA